MKKTLSKLTVVLTLTTISLTAFSQDYSDQAKNYFGKYTDGQFALDLCMKSLPTLEDCKLVFKGSNAYTYFGYIEDMKSKMKDEAKKDTSKFVDIKVESFTTADIQQGKGNYAGGMKDILDKLQPTVTFYKIDFLRTKGAEYGVAYKYWVKIENRWVFFPKPWTAFEK